VKLTNLVLDRSKSAMLSGTFQSLHEFLNLFMEILRGLQVLIKIMVGKDVYINTSYTLGHGQHKMNNAVLVFPIAKTILIKSVSTLLKHNSITFNVPATTPI
jgi:hypothetical protein